jgi:hypothetical protein
VTGLANFPLAPAGASWSFSAADGNAIVKRGGWPLYKRVHFYFNPEGDKDTKGTYKLPYAKVQADSVRTFRSALLAVQGVLLGARGGADIPSADKKGIARQVIKGLRRFDTEPSDKLRDLAKSEVGWETDEFDLEGYLAFYESRGVETIRDWFNEALDAIMVGSEERDAMTETVIKRSDRVQTPHTFRVVLPVKRAETRISRAAGGDATEYWLHIEASGPERDEHGTRMSDACLERFVEYAVAGIAGEPLPYLDGHYQDLLAGLLGEVHSPKLTDKRHFAVDVLLDRENPQSMRLFRDIERGKRHGASIAGIVHDYSIEKYVNDDGEECLEQVFDDIELVEVSRTTWPSWRDSFTAMVEKHMHPAGADELMELMARRSMIADARPLLSRVLEAHDVDEAFEVSDGPWAEVTDLTHRYQYAIVRRHADGAFSPRASGYAHHTATNGVSREGLGLAVASLVDDLSKEEWPFLKVEMEHAARHLARHVVNELGEPVPADLEEFVDIRDITEVAMSVQTDSATEEQLSQESVQTDVVEEPTEVIERAAEDQKVVDETDSDATDVQIVPEVLEPDVLVPGVARADTAEADDAEPEVETVEEVQEPDAETEPERVIQSAQPSELTGRLESGLVATKMSALLYTTQQMLAEKVWAEDQPADDRVQMAGEVLDEFVLIAKGMLPALASAPMQEDLLNEFYRSFEVVEGTLTQKRANRIVEMSARFINEVTELSQVLLDMDLLDDTAVETVVEELREEVSDGLSEIRTRMQTAMTERVQTEQEKQTAILDQLQKKADQAAQPKRTVAPAAPVQTEPISEGTFASRAFIQSVKESEQRRRRR